MIVVDDREVLQHPEIPELLPEVSVVRLEAADYAFLDRDHNPLGIERSEIGNLVQKMMSGQLESQILKCQEAYSSIILLIEGVYDDIGKLLALYKSGNRGYYRSRVFPHMEYGFVMSLVIRLSELGIEIVSTPNFGCSMTTIATIYQQRTKPESEHTLFKKTRVIKIPTKMTSNPAVPRLIALCPRLSEKVAIRLMNKFGTIWTILNSEDSELLSIDGFGRGALTRLKTEVGKE